MDRIFFLIGALSAFVGVAAGAFGAHGLKERLSAEMLARANELKREGIFGNAFVFYSERMDTLWILSSAEFIAHSHQNKTGINSGRRTIWFNGKNTKAQTEHTKPQFEKFIAKNFQRLLHEDPDATPALLPLLP